MVLEIEAERKKEERKDRNCRYYKKKRAAKPKVIKPKVRKPKVDRNVRVRRYHREKKAGRTQNGVETNIKTPGESDILSGVAAGGNDLVHCNVDALNSAAIESVGVAARVTERHDADSAQDNDDVPGNSGCHDMSGGQCKMLVSTGKAFISIMVYRDILSR
jgi:hypothetical protein